MPKHSGCLGETALPLMPTIIMNPQTLLHLILGICILSSSAYSQSESIRALLITGGGAHNYKAQSDLLPYQIDRYSKLDIEWTIYFEDNIRDPIQLFNRNEPDYPRTYPEWIESKGFDVIIYNLNHRTHTGVSVERILEPHRKGIPAILLHGSTISYGGLEPDSAWAQFQGVQTSFKHGAQLEFVMEFLEPEHEILKGFSSWKTRREEMYPILTTPKDYPATLSPLMQAHHPWPGDTRMTSWTQLYGDNRTRVFATTLGNYLANLSDPRFAEFVTRGLLWAMGYPVDEYLEKEVPTVYEFEHTAPTFDDPENAEHIEWISEIHYSTQERVRGFEQIRFKKEGAWIKHPAVDFGSGSREIHIRYQSSEAGALEIRKGALDGPVLAKIELKPTKSWYDFQTKRFPIKFTQGINDLYFFSLNLSDTQYDGFTVVADP